MVMTPAKFWIKKYRSSDRLKSHPESFNNPQSDPRTSSHLPHICYNIKMTSNLKLLQKRQLYGLHWSNVTQILLDNK